MRLRTNRVVPVVPPLFGSRWCALPSLRSSRGRGIWISMQSLLSFLGCGWFSALLQLRQVSPVDLELAATFSDEIGLAADSVQSRKMVLNMLHMLRRCRDSRCRARDCVEGLLEKKTVIY